MGANAFCDAGRQGGGILHHNAMTNGRGSLRLRLVPLLLVVLICPFRAQAQSLAFWGDLIFTFVQDKKLEWTAVGSFRSDGHLLPGTIFTRVSTEARFALFPRFWLWGQYTFINEGTRADGRVDWNNRPQAGIIYRFRTFRADNDLTGQTRIERNIHIGGVAPSNDYRQAIELRNDKGKIAPWFWEELFFDNSRGFFRTRSRAGLIFNLREGRQLSVAYQFQSTQSAQARSPQHAIVARFWLGRRLSWRGRTSP